MCRFLRVGRRVERILADADLRAVRILVGLVRQRAGCEAVAVDDQDGTKASYRPGNGSRHGLVVRPVPSLEMALPLFFPQGAPQRLTIMGPRVDRSHSPGGHGLLFIVREPLDVANQAADREHDPPDFGSGSGKSSSVQASVMTRSSRASNTSASRMAARSSGGTSRDECGM